MEVEKILKEAIRHYGKKSQMMVFIEELVELQSAIMSGHDESIIEEIADVAVCLRQMFMIFDLTDEYLPSYGSDDDFFNIMTDCILFVCRQNRGRGEDPASLWLLSGWLRARGKSMNAVDQVKSIAAKKINRLDWRINNEY